MSKKTISIWAKKNFLLWFLESYQFQSDHPRRLLMQLIESEELLSRICLVYHSLQLRPLLVISAENTGMPALIFKTATKSFTDSISILEQIQTNPAIPIYLTIYFTEREFNEPYQAVADEPSGEPGASASKQYLMDFEISLWTEAYRLEIERADLMRQIDAALDSGNKRLFRRLVKKLKSLP